MLVYVPLNHPTILIVVPSYYKFKPDKEKINDLLSCLGLLDICYLVLCLTIYIKAIYDISIYLI